MPWRNSDGTWWDKLLLESCWNLGETGSRLLWESRSWSSSITETRHWTKVSKADVCFSIVKKCGDPKKGGTNGPTRLNMFIKLQDFLLGVCWGHSFLSHKEFDFWWDTGVNHLSLGPGHVETQPHICEPCRVNLHSETLPTVHVQINGDVLPIFMILLHWCHGIPTDSPASNPGHVLGLHHCWDRLIHRPKVTHTHN